MGAPFDPCGALVSKDRLGDRLLEKACECCGSLARFPRKFTMDRDSGESVEVCKVCYTKLCDIAIELRVHAGFLALELLKMKTASVKNDSVGRIVLQAVKE